MRSELVAINEMVMGESAFVERLTSEVGKVIVGQRAMIDRVLVGLLSGGHVLLQGVPGLAKTLTVRTLASAMKLGFSADSVHARSAAGRHHRHHDLQSAQRRVQRQEGPGLRQLGARRRDQPRAGQGAKRAARSDAGASGHDRRARRISSRRPFMVMATQNPIEQEGTYPLPEAQLDRFMLMIKVDYPSRDEERQIMDRMTARTAPTCDAVITPEELLRARDVAQQVYIDDKLRDYIVDLVYASREPRKCGLEEVADFIEYGASPRASIYLATAAKAHAFIQHRGFVTPEDIKTIGMDVLRHRIILTYEAEAEEVTTEDVIRKLFEQVEVP
jgi:MoxR-like ATPase